MVVVTCTTHSCPMSLGPQTLSIPSKKSSSPVRRGQACPLLLSLFTQPVYQDCCVQQGKAEVRLSLLLLFITLGKNIKICLLALPLPFKCLVTSPPMTLEPLPLLGNPRQCAPRGYEIREMLGSSPLPLSQVRVSRGDGIVSQLRLFCYFHHHKGNQ